MNHSKFLSNIILFTRGTRGDLYPFLRMGCGLKEKGCDITLLSNFCYEQYAHREGFNFLALDDETSFEILNNTPEFHSKLPAKLKLYTDHILSSLENELKIIESRVIIGNTVIVAHSNDYLAPLFAMEKYNVPVYLCMLAPSYVHGFSLFEAVLTRLSVELNDIRNRVGLAPVQDWKKWLKQFHGCFAFWPDWFSDEAQEIIPDLEYVGFLSIDSIEEKPLQDEIKNFIGNNTKNILITHGTSKPFSDQFFKLGIKVCQLFDCKLIVSTPFRDLLPENLPENVIWVEYSPFHELLPLVDLIIHHGGIGTAREAIGNLIPQLIIGQGFDRQHNGRAIQKLGLGDWIVPSALSEDILHQKVKCLLSDPDIKSKCGQYKFFLYNEKALTAFYARITSSEIGGAYGTSNRMAVAERAAISTEMNFALSPTCTVEKINSSVGSKISSDHSPKLSQTLNKQQLLLRMLKNKTREANAQLNKLEPGRGN